MANWNDHAPIGHTCPTIDSVISSFNECLSAAEYIAKHGDSDITDSANDIIWTARDAIQTMEDIRSANSELRDWGNEEYDRAETAENERDIALCRIEELEQEVSGLKDTIDELEEQLNNVMA